MEGAGELRMNDQGNTELVLKAAYNATYRRALSMAVLRI
jgi:hypothetical protein